MTCKSPRKDIWASVQVSTLSIESLPAFISSLTSTGRRQCVGYNLASSNQFIVFARLLYCFDVEEDPAHPLVVEKPFPLTALEEPCKVKIKPRSEAHRRLIETECQTAATF